MPRYPLFQLIFTESDVRYIVNSRTINDRLCSAVSREGACFWLQAIAGFCGLSGFEFIEDFFVMAVYYVFHRRADTVRYFALFSVHYRVKGVAFRKMLV